LFLGGVLLIIFELWPGKKKEIGEKITEISYRQSFLIGVAQSVAIIPGVSRSAATILGGLMLGIERKTIVEFSFLLAVPTMLAATGLDLIKSAGQFSLSQWNFLAVGFIVSFIVALASIKFLVNFIKKRSFIPFGIYRIVVSLAFWLLILN
jgi:undecaprenyl-diphosphatase